MSIELDRKALESIKSYSYKTNGLTWIERNIFEHFWNFSLTLCPSVIFIHSHPNLNQ
jgi:hypothetical protein